MSNPQPETIDDAEPTPLPQFVGAAIRRHGMAACVKALGLADATLARLAGDLPRLPMTDAVVAMRRPAIERLDRLADARAKAEAASKAEQP